MAPPPDNLGGVLADDIVVFRAFAEKSYRRRKSGQVRYLAYLLRESDIQDGLSVGLSPEAAVKYLRSNQGYCQILVGDIHALDGNLEVRFDLADEHHAFICNLPLMTISDYYRDQATAVANELARKSRLITCDPYVPA
jgi:hypothetical protein